MKSLFPSSKGSKVALNLKRTRKASFGDKLTYTFVNSKGDKPSYTNWEQGQPDNLYDPEKWVAMSISDGKWFDIPGYNAVYVLCVQDCSRPCSVNGGSCENGGTCFDGVCYGR